MSCKKSKCKRVAPERHSRDTLVQKYGFNITSQGGEDGVLQRVFQVILNDENCERWCVEFGAWDGKHLSNTWNLLNNQGWCGVLIEADTVRFKEMQDSYQLNENVVCLEQMVELDGPLSLEATLDRVGRLPVDFDLLSIDIDGADYHIWDGIVKYQPKVVVIEFNPTIPNNVEFIQPRDLSVYQGSSLRALVNLAASKGYNLISTTTFNAIFVRQNDFARFEMDHCSIDSLHDVTMGTEIFQLYDGTLKLTGCKKLIWHKVPIDEEKLQILPKSRRIFPFSPAQAVPALQVDHEVKGREMLELGQNEQAVKSLLEAVYEESNAIRTGLLGEAYLRCRKFTAARYWLNQSLVLEPLFSTHKSLVKLYDRMGMGCETEKQMHLTVLKDWKSSVSATSIA